MYATVDEVRRTVRRLGLTVGILGLAIALVGAVPAGAGAGVPEDSSSTFVVRKVVVGAGAPTQITVSCAPIQGEGGGGGIIGVLNFDASGNPTTAAPPEGWQIADGAWVLVTSVPGERQQCLFLELPNGATAVEWTCAFEIQLGTTGEDLGCAAPSGSLGSAPEVVFGAVFDEVESQAVTVVFTNTFAAAPPPPAPPAPEPVAASPTFTG